MDEEKVEKDSLEFLSKMEKQLKKVTEYPNGVVVYYLPPSKKELTFYNVNKARLNLGSILTILFRERKRVCPNHLIDVYGYAHNIFLSGGYFFFQNNKFLAVGYIIQYEVTKSKMKQSYVWHNLRTWAGGDVYLLDGKKFISPDLDKWLKEKEKERKLTFIRKYNLIYDPKYDEYNCDGNLHVTSSIDLVEGNIPVKLGIIKGHCSFTNCSLLSLENCPRRVEESFVIDGNYLKSLKGCPLYVGGNFSIHSCRYLTSLQYSPKFVGGDFDAGYCYRLSNLEGITPHIGGNVIFIWDYNLVSLKGLQETIYGTLNCKKCSKLNTLLGAPKKVYGKIILNETPIPMEDRKKYIKETEENN